MSSHSTHLVSRPVRDTRGISLIVAMGLMVLLLLIAVGAGKLVQAFMQSSQQALEGNGAYYAAEGGTEMALYDMTAYGEGYQTSGNPTTGIVCGRNTDITAQQTVSNPVALGAAPFNQVCTNAAPFRFVNFTDNGGYGARGYWQIISRALPVQSPTPADHTYQLPDPYLNGSSDGVLDPSKWGTLVKNRLLNMSLLTNTNPSALTPSAQYTPINKNTKVTFFVDPAEAAHWKPTAYRSASLMDVTRSDGQDDVLTWTLSAVDTTGRNYTLQGVVWESDFQKCTADGAMSGTTNTDGSVLNANEYVCFTLDLSNTTASALGIQGDPQVGEDINRNLPSSVVAPAPGYYDRVAALKQTYTYNWAGNFLQALQDSYTTANPWVDARLTVALVSSLSETSGLTSNTLRYKIMSTASVPDEYTYIVSEGYAGPVKQTIQTKFQKSATIPIFSYAIFQ